MRWNEQHIHEAIDAAERPRRGRGGRCWLARPIEHGEIWEAQLGKVRPVVIASRDDPRGRRDMTTVAAVTSTIRDLPTQVLVDHREGLAHLSAVNCDDLVTIRKTRLKRRVGRLSAARLDQFDDALRFALQLR